MEAVLPDSRFKSTGNGAGELKMMKQCFKNRRKRP